MVLPVYALKYPESQHDIVKCSSFLLKLQATCICISLIQRNTQVRVKFLHHAWRAHPVDHQIVQQQTITLLHLSFFTTGPWTMRIYYNKQEVWFQFIVTNKRFFKWKGDLLISEDSMVSSVFLHHCRKERVNFRLNVRYITRASEEVISLFDYSL